LVKNIHIWPKVGNVQQILVCLGASMLEKKDRLFAKKDPDLQLIKTGNIFKTKVISGRDVFQIHLLIFYMVFNIPEPPI